MMAARPRQPRNRNLPPNLYRDSLGYFTYRHPITKLRHGVGCNEAKAVQAANVLNLRLMRSPDIVNRVLGATTVKSVIERFEREFLPEKDVSARTANETRIRINRIKRELGEVDWESLNLIKLSDWLKPLTREAYIKYRSQFIEIFRFTCSIGLSERNIAELTLKKASQKRKRLRWTREQISALYAAAPPWLQIAIDLAIVTLQRREDLVDMKFSDIENGRLLVVQKKTQKHLAIKIGSDLEQIISRARQSGIDCPYIIHRRPRRKCKTKNDRHWASVSCDFLTDSISEIRDSLPIFAEWSAEEKPTLHELRSFGAHDYREQGFDDVYIQSLLGHKNKKMTEHYLSGHRVSYDEVLAR